MFKLLLVLVLLGFSFSTPLSVVKAYDSYFDSNDDAYEQSGDAEGGEESGDSDDEGSAEYVDDDYEEDV